MTEEQPLFIVVTDLDGTLLDHHTYSWEAAASTLAELKQKNIPVIINTSKTFEEVVPLQESLGLDSPFIVENGSAVFLPKKQFSDLAEPLDNQQGFYRRLLGQDRKEIVSYLQGLRRDKGWKFEGYSDWSVEKVAELTGLDANSARLSQTRAFSEPLLWQDSEESFLLFSEILKQRKLTLLKGGRFYHVLGKTHKGMATKWVQSLYPKHTTLVCLGDSPNDVDMLDVADIPVWVKSEKQKYPELTHPNSKTILTSGLGPIGWAEALNKILQQFK